MNINEKIEQAKGLPVDQGLKLYASMVVGENKVEDFTEWAFGKTPTNLREIPNLWNERHGSVMKVSSEDKALDTFDKMLKIYVANTEGFDDQKSK